MNSYLSARERLESWIDEYSLCLRYCGLTGDDSICFNHQIRKCNGICAEQEDIEFYNKHAFQVLEKYVFANPNFIIMEKGRKPEEQSVVLIENGHYAGYGYMDSSEQFTSPEELKGVVKRTTFFPDSNDLVKGWLKRNRKAKQTVLSMILFLFCFSPVFSQTHFNCDTALWQHVYHKKRLTV